MSTVAIPGRAAAAGVKRVRPLDVRPVIASGGDPFRLIMTAIDKLAPDEAVELVVGFEPAPLYGVLASMAYATETEREGADFHVFIFREAPLAGPHGPPEANERPPLQEPVELDVRGLEPPQPLLAIFRRLGELGPGAQLVVRHHREPRLLYDKLAARGYAARSEQLPDGEFRVRIAPAWAFEGEAK